MRLCLPACALLVLAACGNEKEDHAAAAANSAAENASIAASIAEKQRTEPVWSAGIEPGSNAKTRKLIVTGSFIRKDSTGKPKLTRAKPQGTVELSELILDLSHEPARQGMPARVTYEEQVSRPERFNKVTIRYQNKPVAVIQPVAGITAR